MKKDTKRPYRIRNWKKYNTALVQRGSLTVWMDEKVLRSWINQEKTGRPGASDLYSDIAIQCGLTLGAVYNLPLRQTQGLLASVLQLLDPALPVPNDSPFCRRRKTLAVAAPRRLVRAAHLVVDSTGVKVYGEGEWKVRPHGWSKRRTGRKLPIGVDEATGEILAAVVSTNNKGEAQVLPEWLDQIGGAITQVSADGSYDSRSAYEAIAEREARAVIPPRRGARIWQHGNHREARLARDENLRRIRQVGRQRWKQESGYHRRSLAETAVFRLKTIFGGRVRARLFDAQAQELFLCCLALNRMTKLGMPESYAV